MSQPSAAGSNAIDLALTVPAGGDLRLIAADLVAKIAEYLGAEAAGAGEALQRAAAQVAPEGTDAEIQFEFRTVDRELQIRARCDGRSSEVSYRLTA